MERLLVVCAAGALGTGTRYLVTLWAEQKFGRGFPIGTLLVNLVGCFLMAFVMHVAASFSNFPHTLKFALAAGFLGGLTTYSSFNYDTTRLLQQGSVTAGVLNLAMTLTGCYLSGLAGLAAARAIVR